MQIRFWSDAQKKPFASTVKDERPAYRASERFWRGKAYSSASRGRTRRTGVEIVSEDKRTTSPGANGGGIPAACTTTPCPNCVYWNQDHYINYSGPDSKFLTSTQIAAVTVAFRLEANLAAGNITVTSIFKWGTVAADVTAAQKADTITQFKAKVMGWGNRFNMKITDPICGEKTLPILFRLLWSPADTAVTTSYRVNLYKTYPRAGVTGWNIDIGYDSDVTPNSAWVLSHEYGHTVCLQDEYFYAGVTAATVVYKKADSTTESVTLEPSPGNIMSLNGDTTYLQRFFYFTAIEAQELLRSKSGRSVVCQVV